MAGKTIHRLIDEFQVGGETGAASTRSALVPHRGKLGPLGPVDRTGWRLVDGMAPAFGCVAD